MLLVPADYLPAGTSIRGGTVVKAIFNSDFVAWVALKLMPIMPGGMTRMILGTDPAVVRAAEPNEKARVQQVLEHLLPVSTRFEGMQFDIKTAAMHEPYSIEKIARPVLTISAEDDRFGTANRARHIAASVPDGRAIIFPTGGHALVGHSTDALREITSFLQTVGPSAVSAAVNQWRDSSGSGREPRFVDPISLPETGHPNDKVASRRSLAPLTPTADIPDASRARTPADVASGRGRCWLSAVAAEHTTATVRPMAYELHRCPTIQGRGEFVRHAPEAVDAAYVDVARGAEDSRRLTHGLVTRTPWAKTDRQAILAPGRSTTRGQ